MQNIDFKKLVPHGIALLVFVLITSMFFYPMLQGKVLSQHDVLTHAGNSKECKDYRAIYEEEPLWTNSSFGGMPAYFVSMETPANLISHLYMFIHLGMTPASYLLIALLGFYLLMITMRVDPWLAIAGSIAFALSSYLLIVIGAGHSTKATAIGLMAPVLAGVILAFRGKYLLGAAITGMFLAIMIRTNHLQIIYYLLYVLVLYGVFYGIESIREKTYMKFLKAAGVLIIAAVLAAGTNSTKLLLSDEYSEHSTRGKSELTNDQDNKTSGLDKDYVTGWSYGVAESFTLLIPHFSGGPSAGGLGKDSETYKQLRSMNAPNAANYIKQLPLYWGAQPMQSGPVYVGGIVCFLFVLGLFVIKGPLKWWLLSATILSIVLAWGKNFPDIITYNADGVVHNPITDFFLDHVPLYNKFRTVTMTLVIAGLTMPLLAILALKEFVSRSGEKEEMMKKLKYSFGVVGGLLLVFIVAPGMFFDFSLASDAQLKSIGWSEVLIGALQDDRESMLRSDALRSLIFIVITSGALWAVLTKKLKTTQLFMGMALLFVVDMGGIDKRYLGADNFERKKGEKPLPYSPSTADMAILQSEMHENENAANMYAELVEKAMDEKRSGKVKSRKFSQAEMVDLQFTALNFNSNFRVMNLSVSTFNDANTSYYHKSVGGYHGAKMKRYQEFISAQLSRRNPEVMNMLNVKYVIAPGEQGLVAQQNPRALGNAWFVDAYQLVDNADQELEALGILKTKTSAVIDKRFEAHLADFTPGDTSEGKIELDDYKPNHLVYSYKTQTASLAVFSEIYYPEGWNAYIDGEPADHFRANYILRAMVLPPGEHKVEFKFEPDLYSFGEGISLASSGILLLLFFGVLFMEFKKMTPQVIAVGENPEN